jgi:hypothetical protein
MEYCAARGLRLNVIVAGTGEHDVYLEDLEAVARSGGVRIATGSCSTRTSSSPSRHAATARSVRRHHQHVVLVGQG